MRTSIGIGLALLLAIAPAASAQGPVATVPLAAGEMLLELNSTGSAMGRADSAEVTVNMTISGEDERDLRRQYDRIVSRLRTAARDSSGEIQVGELVSHDDMMMTQNTVDLDMNSTIVNSPTEMMSGHSGSASAVIRIRDLSRIDALARTLEGIEGIYSETAYRASDLSAVRRQARDNAIAAARSEADSYAASLGMRVSRIARVTERLEVDFMAMMMGDPSVANLAMSGAPGSDPNIPAYVRVGVDFILAPR